MYATLLTPVQNGAGRTVKLVAIVWTIATLSSGEANAQSTDRTSCWQSANDVIDSGRAIRVMSDTLEAVKGEFVGILPNSMTLQFRPIDVPQEIRSHDLTDATAIHYTVHKRIHPIHVLLGGAVGLLAGVAINELGQSDNQGFEDVGDELNTLGLSTLAGMVVGLGMSANRKYEKSHSCR